MVQLSCSISDEADAKLRKMMEKHIRNISNEIEYIIMNSPFVEEQNEEQGCNCNE